MNASEAASQAIRRGRALIAVDFDGTIAPIVDHPDDAIADPEALEHIRALAVSDNIAVAVVSGRSLADLRAHLGELPGVTLIGEHGNDTGEESDVPETFEEARRFVETLRAGREIVVEEKSRSVAFHTRTLDAESKSQARSMLQTWAREHPDVTILEGKEVIELSIADRTKGDAVLALGADCDALIYIGDDTTDETVFAVLGPEDVGVKVGPGPTAAGYRVDDVPGVVEVLRALALISS